LNIRFLNSLYSSFQLLEHKQKSNLKECKPIL
jgi:hypothetical protein